MSRPEGNIAWAEDWKEELCARIADGRSLRSVCGDTDMPAWSTVGTHLKSDGEFSAQYARAREHRADAMFDEILDIADDNREDTRTLNDGTFIVNRDNIQRARLRVDARKWVLAKMQPKKYGDRVSVDANATMADLSPEEQRDRLLGMVPALKVMLKPLGLAIVDACE